MSESLLFRSEFQQKRRRCDKYNLRYDITAAAHLLPNGLQIKVIFCCIH